MDRAQRATPRHNQEGTAMHDMLKRGSHGAEVEALQMELNEFGVQVDIDGHFGPKTEEAVKHFQTAFGLHADGIVGPQTRAALQKALADKQGNA
jgi:peptidoglycan hydrolase-like protein with peptidoglycan-binding domain